MDNLNRFCSFSNVPSDGRVALREYFLETKFKHLADSRKKFLVNLSPALKERATWEIYENSLSRLPFLASEVRSLHGYLEPVFTPEAKAFLVELALRSSATLSHSRYRLPAWLGCERAALLYATARLRTFDALEI